MTDEQRRRLRERFAAYLARDRAAAIATLADATFDRDAAKELWRQLHDGTVPPSWIPYHARADAELVELMCLTKGWA